MTPFMLLFVFINTVIGCIFQIAIITLYYSFTKRSKLYKKVAAELEKVIKERDAAIEGLFKKEQ
ncbi:hypothetical protein [Bartonella krasnovii]|uniref:Uncharacterized protein n=1 Tax=Bartonella krasnovii TaxID=2267275 RepID=A0ABY3VZD1_9HYPH|nr:hypothetical protein [Bartonella krasnovii]UNF28640.1 hypothetical protein MNL13_05250 [Bartonella krasnovii]UNF35016.1 hypothetical protein MNL12_05250 [Bartonella krasnovii]UNF36652.1 hypothetical protein MNL11_05980 [Bartonella krasnovii]UNF38424.1 hypothetical protein MNL10_06690 [Bartonella krasnovii]UNF41811.1 hypothetical protein MNL08_06435 [Bartonella krasnovii]